MNIAWTYDKHTVLQHWSNIIYCSHNLPVIVLLPLDTVVSGDSINKCESGEWKQQQTQGQVHNFCCDVIFGVWFWCRGRVMEVPGPLGCNDLLMTSGHRAESFLSPQVKGQTSHSLTSWFIPWASHNHTESRVYAVSARFCVKWARHRDKNAFSLSLCLGPSFSLVQVGCRMTGRPHLHVVSPQQVNAFKMQQKSSWHLTRECNLNDNTSSLCCSRWRS